MNLKRGMLTTGLLVGSALLFTGCAQAGSSEERADDVSAVNVEAPFYDLLPVDIREAGKIVNAGDLTYAPFEWLQEDGKTVEGIDVDIADALAAQLGVPFEWQDVKTDAALSGIQSKRYNVLLSSMTYTDERAKTYDYVTYLKSASGFLTSPDRVKEFKSAEDFCGLRVAALRGTIQVTQLEELSEKCVADGMGTIDVQTLDSDQSAVLQIRQGGIDASSTNSAVGSYAVTKSDGAIELVPGLIMGDSVYGIMLNKEDAELRDAILAAMNAIIESGAYAEILDKWGVADLALSESLINNGQ